MVICGKEAEEPSIRTLVEHIKSEYPCCGVSARRNESDPPDYYIDINGTVCAAEVTSIMETFQIGGRDGIGLPKQGYRAAFEQFVGKVQKEALQRGVLTGTYSVLFTNRRRFSKAALPKIRSLLLECLARTQDRERTQDELALDDESVPPGSRSVVQVIKHSSEGAKLSTAPAPVFYWPVVEANRMVSAALARKAPRLRDEPGMKVLVLHDATSLDMGDLQQALDGNPECQSFDAVFVTWRDGGGWFAHRSERFVRLLEPQ